jgi:hypothetical protein
MHLLGTGKVVDVRCETGERLPSIDGKPIGINIKGSGDSGHGVTSRSIRQQRHKNPVSFIRLRKLSLQLPIIGRALPLVSSKSENLSFLYLPRKGGPVPLAIPLYNECLVPNQKMIERGHCGQEKNYDKGVITTLDGLESFDPTRGNRGKSKTSLKHGLGEDSQEEE